jgi:glycine dehydrogenase subunit 2
MTAAGPRNAPSIFERSARGRRAWLPPAARFDTDGALDAIPANLRRADPPALPEVSQLDLTRHFNTLAQRNMGIDLNFYPLGSCTMKLNPWLNEIVAQTPAFTQAHPALLDEDSADTSLLHVLRDLSRFLTTLTGLDAVSLQPAAGAHGELTALMMIRKMLVEKGDTNRDTVLIPDTAHGTNPASAARCGFRVVAIKSGPDGLVDVEALRKAADPETTAALMVTNPNTLGRFEKNIESICEIVHAAGGQVYIDGANFNAIVGVTRPGDWGADVMHLNLHTTFSTPHGGGGPGAGPVCCKAHLAPYLPSPVVGVDADGKPRFDHERPQSVGKVHGWNGNVAVHIRAWTYIRSLGGDGLRQVAQMAVLNANYLRAKVAEFLPIPHGKPCMHEFVASGKPLRAHGVKTLDLAKALIDEGFHPPTIYFPLVVDEALMI